MEETEHFSQSNMYMCASLHVYHVCVSLCMCMCAFEGVYL